MVKLKTAVVYLIILGSTLSCSFLSKGYENEYGQFVPKHPHYWLKDKKGHRLPENLDTINVYRLEYTFNRIGIETNYPAEPNEGLGDLKDVFYIKFYSKGRCSTFGTTNIGLKYRDLNPKNSNCTKGYYYSKGGKLFCIEEFVYGESLGDYIRWKYVISQDGDTIRRISKNTVRSIYVRELLPKHWKKYPVDW